MTEQKKRKSLKDLSPTIACDKGFEFELKDPFTDEGLGMFITVIGPESTKVKAFQRKRVNEMLRADAKGPKVQTVEEMEAAAIEGAVVCTVGWRGIVWDEVDGELPFNEDNARVLYEQKFIREQVGEAATTLGNFTPG